MSYFWIIAYKMYKFLVTTRVSSRLLSIFFFIPLNKSKTLLQYSFLKLLSILNFSLRHIFKTLPHTCGFPLSKVFPVQLPSSYMHHTMRFTLIGLLLINLAYGDSECPVELNPQRVVVEYGGSVSVNCSTSVTHHGMGWEVSEGAVPQSRDNLITWRVSNLTQWDIQPFCYLNHKKQCQLELPVTIYKTPDSVSISTVNHTGPMMEGNQYELQCDVLNVAPVQYLTVKWYKGQTLVDQTNFTDTIKTPVDKTVTLMIRPDRADDGAQYRCEAELELGEEGPQPPPKLTSDPLNITVYYKPTINETKLPSVVSVFRGHPVVLVCEADGNPKPTISWNSSTNNPVYSETFTVTVSTPEDLYCIVNNSVDTDIRHVKVSVQDSECPVELNPQRVVVEYGGSVSVDCKTYVLHHGMGWEASEGAVPQSRDTLITWRVSNLTQWDIEPFCYLNHKKQCQLELPVTVYKTPDSVSISTVNHTGPMMEGNQYELQCDVLNVAPVQYLTVKWYKGQTLVDQTNFTDTTKTPVNKTVTLMIRPDRADDGVQYRCEAELELGAEGPQPPPKVTSDPLSITVYYKPQSNLCEDWSPKNGTSLVSYPILNSLEGNPRPNISWRRKSSLLNASVPLNTNDSGKYEITASNELGHFMCTINITVEYAPMIHASQEKFSEEEGSNIILECNWTGYPEPDVWWSFNNKNISTGRRHIIERARSTSAGVYTCSAMNKFGRKDKNVVVEIRGNPPNYIPYVVILVFFVLLVLLIALLFCMWKKKKSSGSYEVQSAKEYELRPLSNGGNC
ncbi:intercellular adhesion molecule 5 isoform X7 [Ctenopharyngodon idella]|uniref:intercellular adhesion molecule 5 isoform X7 n=1 Tax=Ctenopharyngodon idella TaxID=7959 RepID=UPI0022304E0A|nr:intercellular adhesion molecule 5 isoform X7 [Ctenopharyngodon idella]